MNPIRRFASLVLPLLLIAAAPPPVSVPSPVLPDAEPAMWVVKDKDTTIYLFGTFHALDGKRDWFNDEVRAAFDKSQQVVLEIITPEDPTALRATMMSRAMDKSGRTLTSKLSPQGRLRLAEILKKNKLPATALDSFKPFFASLTVATLQFGTMGMGAEHGAEAVIKKAVKASAKTLAAVETVDEQLAILDSLDEPEQLRMLEAALKDEGSMAAEIRAMLAAWYDGDAAAVAKMIQQSDTDGPAFFKLMFTDRNARWTQWVARRLDQPGTVFMAVGAGHLSGDRSVIAMLKQQRLKVKRVQ